MGDRGFHGSFGNFLIDDALGFLDALPPDARHFIRAFLFGHARPPRHRSAFLLDVVGVVAAGWAFHTSSEWASSS